MIVKGATVQDLEIAATETGVRLNGGNNWGDRSPNPRETSEGIRFTLRTVSGPPRSQYKRASIYWAAKFLRGESAKVTTVPGAVCWHGHRDFMRALFKRAPGAVLKSAFATYRGAEDFERTYEATDREVGQGLLFSETCFCSGSPLAELSK